MDYYQVLRVPRDAKPRDITKAYRVLALKYHPDRRNREGLTAESEMADPPERLGIVDKMALINEAYECLKDPEKKRVYDLTGRTDGSGLLGESDEGVLEAADIENFVATYRGSELEREDVREFVRLREGDVSQILEFIPLSTASDLDRLLKIAAEFSGECKAKFDRSCKKVRKNIGALKRKEQRERKRFEKEHGTDSFADLVSKIKQNQKRRHQAGAALGN